MGESHMEGLDLEGLPPIRTKPAVDKNGVPEEMLKGRHHRIFSMSLLGSPMASGGGVASNPGSGGRSPKSPALGRSNSARMQKSPSLSRNHSRKTSFVDFLSDTGVDDIGADVAVNMPLDRPDTNPLRTPSNKNLFSDTWMRSTAEFQRRDPNEKKIPSKDPTLDDDYEEGLAAVPTSVMTRLQSLFKREREDPKREPWAGEVDGVVGGSHAIDVEDEEVDPGWCINLCMTSRNGQAKVTPLLLWRLLFVVLLIGLGLVAITFLVIYNDTYNNRDGRVDVACSTFASSIMSSYGSDSLHVREFSDLVSTFYIRANPPALTENLFQAFSNATHYSLGAVMGISYATRLLQADRPAFESNIGRCISSLQGQCIPIRSEYAPIVFGAFIAENLPGLPGRLPTGLDISDEPALWAAMRRVLSSGQLGALSSPLPVPGSPTRKTMFQFYPVYNVTPPANATPKAYEAAVKGYILAVFNMTEFVNIFSNESSDPLEPIQWRIYDVTNKTEPDLLGSSKFSENNIGWDKDKTRVISLDLGDPARKHELRCKNAKNWNFPWQALEWSIFVLVLVVASCYIIWAAVMSLQRMGRDYTRMKSLKERMAEAKGAAESASKAKGAFLATMSHEIRTPMNGVIGMLNLLLGTRLDATQLDYVETARTSGRALCALINDVLDLSKIEAGHMELENIPFQLVSEIDDVISMFAEKAREKASIELASIVQDTVPRHVIGDPLRFRQVLINLLGNAFKFTKSGHIFVTVRVAEPYEMLDMPDGVLESFANPDKAQPEPKMDSGVWKDEEIKREVSFRDSISETHSLLQNPATWEEDEFLTLSGKEATESCNSWSRIGSLLESSARSADGSEATLYAPGQVVRLVISCEDSGIGIPKWAKAGIFKPFTQADTSTTRLHGGTGIGLTICQRLVDMMGGKLCFVSKAGVGTTFYFDVYLDVADRPAHQPTSTLTRELTSLLQSPDMKSNLNVKPNPNPDPTPDPNSNSNSNPKATPDFSPSPSLKQEPSPSPDAPSAQHTSPPAGSNSSQTTDSTQSADIERRVLIIDHRPVRRAVLCWHLHRLGFEVDFCDSPQDAPVFLRTVAPSPKLSPLPPTPSPDVFSGEQQLYQGPVQVTGSGNMEPCELPTPRLSTSHASGFGPSQSGSQSATGSSSNSGQRQNFFSAQNSPASRSGPLASPTDALETSDSDHAHKTYCAIFVDNEELKVEYSGNTTFDEAYQLALQKCAILCGAKPAANRKVPNGSIGSSYHAPLVLLTRERGTEEVARKAGFDAIVLKPLRRGALSACLVQLFSGAGLARTPSGGIVALGQLAAGHSDSDSPPKEGGRRGSPPLPSGRANGVAAGGNARGGVEVPIQEQGQTGELTALFRGKKLLVVDDNMVNRKVISKMLQRYGAATELVDSGAKAIQSCRHPHTFDLVFMDVQMPMMDGYEATRQIRKLEKEQDPTGGLHVPIFALTADIVVGTREKCTDSGMDGFLSKPIEEDQLYRILPPYFERMARSS